MIFRWWSWRPSALRKWYDRKAGVRWGCYMLHAIFFVFSSSRTLPERPQSDLKVTGDIPYNGVCVSTYTLEI